MTKRPMYLQHVNVYVRNVERSKKWYEELLGLHVYEYRPGWAAFLSADQEQSHEVALMQLGDDAPLQSKGQVGLNHMAWRLESLDDLKEFYRKLKVEGQPIERIIDHGISLGIYLRDPDGNGVEVFYEMPRAEWPVDYNVFTREKTGNGRFPGPWDAEIGRDGSPARRQAAAEWKVASDIVARRPARCGRDAAWLAGTRLLYSPNSVLSVAHFGTPLLVSSAVK